jgi:hypothetical protein
LRRAMSGDLTTPGRAFRFSRRSLERAVVVSQLLAGTPIGPGRNSGAARVAQLA